MEIRSDHNCSLTATGIKVNRNTHWTMRNTQPAREQLTHALYSLLLLLDHTQLHVNLSGANTEKVLSIFVLMSAALTLTLTLSLSSRSFS